LKRELGLRDLTLFIISCIVGTRWIPAAAHAGPGSVTLWLLAAVLFMVPLAFAIAALAARYPGAGGFYLWTRNDFGPWPGFLCFWSYWVAIAFWFPSAAMFYMGAGLYALGPKYQYLAESRPVLLAVALAAIWIALGTNLVGMRIGKWTENVGALATWGVGVLLVAVGAVGQFGGLGTGVSRLPFAVGVDHLLPKAFARVHPRWGTPHFAILLLGVVASFLLIVMQAGDTMRAAYQSLVSLMVITG